MNDRMVDVPTSAATSSSKVGADGVVHPGKAHEAKPGAVINKGVRTVGVGAAGGPACPVCGKTNTLKIHMNKKVGERVYCSSPSCSYDQAKVQQHSEGGIHPNPDIRIMDGRGINPQQKGVRILSKNRMT
jgi:hypothetical protein